MKHALIDNAMKIEQGGIIGRCTCGWDTGHRFSGGLASAAFADHLEETEGKMTTSSKGERTSATRMAIIIEGKVYLDAYEDSRTVLTTQVDETVPEGTTPSDDGLVVSIRSVSSKKDHALLESLIGKKVRVMIEVLP